MASQPQPQYRINLRWYRLFYWPILLPVALLLALFNKVSPVPFKIYPIRVDRVGQMAANQEDFLCELEQGLHPKEYRVFVHRDRPSNGVLLDMLKRVMPIHNIFLPLFDVCHKMGGLGVSSMFLHSVRGDDPNCVVCNSSQHLYFSKEEEKEARRQCKELGINPDEPFIPVLGRDSSYLSHLDEPTDNKCYRNVDINTFTQAMESLANNYKVIRMGSVVKDKLQSTHPNVLDYSLSGKRTELLDVYLSAKCLFFLTVGSGIDSIASCNFRRPIMYVNYIPPSYVPTMKSGAIFILKKYWHAGENRYLGLRELYKTGIGDMLSPAILNPMGIFVHDNTPEEMAEFTKEMTGRIENTWEESDEDRALQEKFWNIVKEFYPNHQLNVRIGASYLKKNLFWLD